MGRRKYTVHDTLAVEHGVADAASVKKAAFIDERQARRDNEERVGLRQLDRAIEHDQGTAGMSRAMKDRERALPRDTVAELGHVLKDRRLLPPDAVRVPMSKRQRVERLHVERDVSRSLTPAQYKALATLTTDKDSWRRVNQGLADNLGDAQQLDSKELAQVRRVDKAIQAYESQNDRGHRVYLNVDLPAAINHSNVDAFIAHHLPAGSEVYFDQYTGASHNLNEVSDDDMKPRTVALEIHTRRGMFIGKEGDATSNGHLLPRGLKLRVAGAGEASFTRPDGTRGRRMIIHMLDLSDESKAIER